MCYDNTNLLYCSQFLQGIYDESIRYYVQALAMNPKAENAWQYLRISLRYDNREK